MEIKNRIAMAPMTLGFESKDGTINETLTNFWLERAKGGVGLIILDVVTVDSSVPYLGNTISLGDDNLIPSFKVFVDKIHKYGTKVIPQITHPGPESISWTYGVQPVGPSTYPNQFGQMVRELSTEEIKQIVEMYGDAARRAKEAGCDGVQLHCAHAYMLAGSFLSPLRNKRTDEYGGDLDGRAKFTLEIIKNMKEKAGEDFPIIMRISGDERVPGGNTINDMLYLIPKFIEAGVDGFEVSGGTQYEVCWKLIPCHGEEVGLNLREAKAIKDISTVPVLMVGKINSPQYANHIIKNKFVDGVVMGRALLSDPHLPNKAKDERFDDIAPCTSCGIGCISREEGQTTATCVINPTVGKEKEMTIIPAEDKKKVLIIGGGLAGLETARVAALRGHNVTIFEKNSKLGGQINLASVPPFKQELTKWITYLTKQINKLGVKVQFNQDANVESIKEFNPDTVVIATGADPLKPNIKGIDQKNVITGNEVLKGLVPIVSGNILIIGGGMIGCEVADTLLHNSRGEISIQLVEMLDQIAQDMPPNNRMPLINRLYSKGVKINTSTKVLEIKDKKVLVEKMNKEEILNSFDHIILCCGSKSKDNLYKDIKNLVPEAHIIGDAKSPRKALQAVAEGSTLGRLL